MKKIELIVARDTLQQMAKVLLAKYPFTPPTVSMDDINSCLDTVQAKYEKNGDMEAFIQEAWQKIKLILNYADEGTLEYLKAEAEYELMLSKCKKRKKNETEEELLKDLEAIIFGHTEEIEEEL